MEEILDEESIIESKKSKLPIDNLKLVSKALALVGVALALIRYLRIDDTVGLALAHVTIMSLVFLLLFVLISVILGGIVGLIPIVKATYRQKLTFVGFIVFVALCFIMDLSLVILLFEEID